MKKIPYCLATTLSAILAVQSLIPANTLLGADQKDRGLSDVWEWHWWSQYQTSGDLSFYHWWLNEPKLVADENPDGDKAPPVVTEGYQIDATTYGFDFRHSPYTNRYESLAGTDPWSQERHYGRIAIESLQGHFNQLQPAVDISWTGVVGKRYRILWSDGETVPQDLPIDLDNDGTIDWTYEDFPHLVWKDHTDQEAGKEFRYKATQQIPNEHLFEIESGPDALGFGSIEAEDINLPENPQAMMALSAPSAPPEDPAIMLQRVQAAQQVAEPLDNSQIAMWGALEGGFDLLWFSRFSASIAPKGWQNLEGIAWEDPDNDGLPNILECHAGTNPVNANSRIEAYLAENEKSLTLYYYGVDGSVKYTLQIPLVLQNAGDVRDLTSYQAEGISVSTSGSFIDKVNYDRPMMFIEESPGRSKALEPKGTLYTAASIEERRFRTLFYWEKKKGATLVVSTRLRISDLLGNPNLERLVRNPETGQLAAYQPPQQDLQQFSIQTEESGPFGTSNTRMYRLEVVEDLDQDGDGLTDYEESLLAHLGFDKTQANTDGDLASDYEELYMGTDPTQDFTVAGVRDGMGDADGDGILDLEEVRFQLDQAGDDRLQDEAKLNFAYDFDQLTQVNGSVISLGFGYDAAGNIELVSAQ